MEEKFAEFEEIDRITTPARCAHCNGSIIDEVTKTEYRRVSGRLDNRPSPRPVRMTTEHQFYCSCCGLMYKFLPTAINVNLGRRSLSSRRA